MFASSRFAAVGLVLSLTCGAALAQSPPQPDAPAPQPSPASGNAPGLQPPPGLITIPGIQADQAAQAGSGRAGQVFQMPDGSFVIAEPTAANPGPAGQTEPDAENGPEPGPMHRHEGHRPPPPPPPARGASFHFHGPVMNLDVKCADDEPTRVCVDAASALIDKLRNTGNSGKQP